MGEKRNERLVLWRGGTGDAAVERWAGDAAVERWTGDTAVERVACTATRSQVMSGPLLLPRWLHGSQGAVLMSVVPITTKGHEDACGLGCHPKPC